MRRAVLISLVFATLSFLGSRLIAAEQVTNEMCLACHDTVDAAKFAG